MKHRGSGGWSLMARLVGLEAELERKVQESWQLVTNGWGWDLWMFLYVLIIFTLPKYVFDMSPNGLTTQNYWLFLCYVFVDRHCRRLVVHMTLNAWWGALAQSPTANIPRFAVRGWAEGGLKGSKIWTLAGKKSSRFSTTFGRDSCACFTVAAVFRARDGRL